MRTLDRQLFEAAREGRANEVHDLAAKGADVNAKHPAESDHGRFLDQVTPLMAAAASPRSNAITVQALLESGADPRATSAGGVTAFWYAAGGGTGYSHNEDLDPDHPFHNWGGGDVQRLQLLYEAGGDPNETANNGRSAIGEACSLGDPERVAFLIEHGASVGPSQRGPSSLDKEFKDMQEYLDEAIAKVVPNPSETDIVGDYKVPLFEAARSGSAKCVDLILATGFPAHFRCNGDTALHEAGSVEVAQLLLAAGVEPQEGAFSVDPLDEAFSSAQYDIAAILLDRMAPGPDRQAYIDEKLVKYVPIYRNLIAARMLLERGANPRAKVKGFGSALHYACWQGDTSEPGGDSETEELVQLLIDAGADVNMPAHNGYTPLHHAVEGDWGSPPAVSVLLKNGAFVNPIDAEGRTPLMLAADHGEAECIKLLIAAGADQNIKDKDGKRAGAYAESHLKSWRSIAEEDSKSAADPPDYRREALVEAEESARLLGVIK